METASKSFFYAVWFSFMLFSVIATAPNAISQQVDGQDDLALPSMKTNQQVSPPMSIASLPDSPGATFSKSRQAADEQSSSSQASNPLIASQLSNPPIANKDESQQAQSSPPLPAFDQTSTQKPVGTAAAESIHASGVAASEPAGMAIAPTKQRRVRTIVLRVGAIVGATVAVGSVVALSQATPSKPPGAR
jgi:hypothetical protein